MKELKILVLALLSMLVIGLLPITLIMKVATACYLCFIFGLYYRKNRKVHVRLMATGIAGDLSIVLLLEFQRAAIDTALSFKLGFWQQLHIGSSFTAVILYIPVIYLGSSIIFGGSSLKKRLWHIRIALVAFIFRTMGFLLMFTLLK